MNEGKDGHLVPGLLTAQGHKLLLEKRCNLYPVHHLTFQEIPGILFFLFYYVHFKGKMCATTENIVWVHLDDQQVKLSVLGIQSPVNS